MTEHPFPTEIVRDVATETGVSTDRLVEMSRDLQEYLERDDGGYEYSTRHNYGWRDEDAYYVYGSANAWESFANDLPVTTAEASALRELHYRTMLASAATDGRERRVREMLDDGNEPIVVSGLAGEEAGFGQDV